ncbi:MAG TPA: transketolase, partial [Gammaproteobacteria bacterium]|nr:transketolase [Gammaproteobacteria bacterium]
GEDGPTHQPVEQTANLRMTPNLSVWRPCDMVESAVAWKAAVASRETPTALIFTRQKTQAQTRDQAAFDSVHRGGYVLRDGGGSPQAILIATGSEVGLAMQAAELLEAEGINARVVSMPCVEV